MSESKVIGMVKDHVERAGSLRALSREWDVAPSYLCDLLQGRRAPGPKILKSLGLKLVKTVDYVPAR